MKLIVESMQDCAGIQGRVDQGAQQGAHLGHDQGGTDAVTGNIGNHHVNGVVIVFEKIVIITTHMGGGDAAPAHFNAEQLRCLVRKKRDLNLLGNLHIPHDAGMLQLGKILLESFPILGFYLADNSDSLCKLSGQAGQQADEFLGEQAWDRFGKD